MSLYNNPSYQSANSQYAVGGSLSLAISSVQEANTNWNNAKDFGLSTGNHWSLPNGTFNQGTTQITKADTHIRYEPDHGHCHGVTKDGVKYTYTN